MRTNLLPCWEASLLLMRHLRVCVRVCAQPINDKAALKLGLVDAVVPADQLLAAARKLALDIAGAARPRLITLERTDKCAVLMARGGRVGAGDASSGAQGPPHPPQ